MEYNDFNVEKAAKNAARHWCSALRSVLAKNGPKNANQRQNAKKKHSSQTQKVTIYYILFRVSRANSFFLRMHSMPAAASTQHTRTHTNLSCHLIWFVVRCWFLCVFFLYWIASKRNEILGIPAFPFVGRIFLSASWAQMEAARGTSIRDCEFVFLASRTQETPV